MWRSTVVGVVALLFASAPALAQNGTISGTVVSAEGARPIADAQVQVVGTSIGGITNEEGRFALIVPTGAYTVRVLRIGFAPDSVRNVTVAPGVTTTVNFQLRSTPTMLAGVVSVGYGTQEARDRTGVVDVVTTEEFNPGRVVSAEQLIQGKVAGVQVVDNGEPGGGMSIRVRGGTSVNASNEPLFVVDGVPLQVGGGISVGRNPLNFLNPADIASITVLKDASATAIYGSRGANGVVLVTTKSGARGTQITYTSTMSTSRVSSEPSMLSAAQFRSAVQEFAPENEDQLGTATTNWRDLVQRNASGREHQLALAGTREDMNYRLSLGLLDQSGVIQGTTVDRISASLNFSDRYLANRLNVRSTLIGSSTDDEFTPGGVIGNANSFDPTQPIRRPTGEYFQWSSNLAPNNPLAELDYISDVGSTYRSVGKLEGEYRLPWIEALSATLRVGYDVTKAERTTFTPSLLRGSTGTLTRRSPTQLNTVLDFFGNYRRAFANFESNLELTGGYSYEETRNDYPEFRAESLSNNLVGPNGVPGARINKTFLTIDESKLASFFGRANIDFRDRYLLTLSVRRDGSSKFGPQEQWGTFPSAAVAWRVVNEPSLQRFTGRLSDLKLRLSWGVNGNQAIANYLAFSSYEVGTSTAQAGFGNEFVTTIRPSGADPGIKWEETTSWNLGLDYGFWNNRISGAIDYYRKKTEDLLFNVPVAAGTNLSNSITTNIGSVENQGLELSINADILDGTRNGFTWSASFNASTNRNELTQINAFGGGTEQILTGDISGAIGSKILVLTPGQPINSFFVYEHRRGPDGRPLYEDTDNDGTVEDTEIYVDRNGDNAITQADRRPFHSPAPKWIFGHTSQMAYRNFDAGFTLRAYRGNYVYNNVASNLGHYQAIRGATPVNLHSSVLRNGFQGPQYFSDVYVEDASFIRMDNLTLGYTFGGLRGVSGLRLFGTIQNVFTMTDYTGVDPLSGINGIDNNIYPFSRTYSAGVTLGF